MKKDKTIPPQFFLRFFRWYCNPKLVNHIEGDLMELYRERVRALGKRKADAKFILDVMLLCRPGIGSSSASFAGASCRNAINLNRTEIISAVYMPALQGCCRTPGLNHENSVVRKLAAVGVHFREFVHH
ncbi:MAG TPA: permease prefix domain 2-containing transporter [Cyclobacteriaceae bacterium]